MEIQEAKEFFYKCNCIDYNMFNANEKLYHEVLSCSTKEQREQWAIEFVEYKADLVYTDPEDGANHFRTACLLLSRRDMRYKKGAEKLVKIYEEAPFLDKFDKLIVAEGVVGNSHAPWGNGFTAMCYYDDYANRLKIANDNIYSKLEFDERDIEEIHRKLPNMSSFLTKEKITQRANKIKEGCEIAYSYMYSDKYIEDKKKFISL